MNTDCDNDQSNTETDRIAVYEQIHIKRAASHKTLKILGFVDPAIIGVTCGNRQHR